MSSPGGGPLKRAQGENFDTFNVVSMDFALELTLLKQQKIHSFVFQIAVLCRSPCKNPPFHRASKVEILEISTLARHVEISEIPTFDARRKGGYL